MGGLDAKVWNHLKFAVPVLLIGSIAIFAFAKDLNLMVLGEESAHSMGVNVHRVRFWLLVLTSLLTGVCVSICGSIGFVGLVIPHIMRLFVGPDHRKLLLSSFLGGAIFIVFADLICRTVVRPEELRLGVVTSLVGGPFFIYLLLKKRYQVRGL